MYGPCRLTQINDADADDDDVANSSLLMSVPGKDFENRTMSLFCSILCHFHFYF